MRFSTLAMLVAVSGIMGPAMSQQASPGNAQDQADKSIKTENSGASGYVGQQDRPGAAAKPPGEASAQHSNDASTATSSNNSGAGIAGAPGNKNGPPAKGTVGSASQNPAVQQQDAAKIQGLPGNKSGPPAKR